MEDSVLDIIKFAHAQGKAIQMLRTIEDRLQDIKVDKASKKDLEDIIDEITTVIQYLTY